MTYNQLTTEEFIRRAKEVHGDKYDYSKVEYIDSRTKVCIICPEHGEFWQQAGSHLGGRGCNLCSKPIYDTKSFVEKSREVHGDKYDYSKVEYRNSHTKVKVICPIHGEFLVSPNNHVRGRGCYECGRSVSAKKQSLSTNEFIERAKKIHGDKYDYSKVNYVNNHTEVCIICPEHGEFLQKPSKHLSGQGCPTCDESSLERDVRVLLERNNIEFIRECDKNVFDWLKKQRLDFYLPKQKIAIECQGEQHYFPVSFGSLSKQTVNQRFKNILKYDKRKKDKCIENGIKLLYYTREDLKKDNEIIDLNVLLKEIKKWEE